MLNVKHTVGRDGVHTIKIGRTTTRLKNIGEVDAFLAGVKLAHIQLSAQIQPILTVKDGRNDC